MNIQTEDPGKRQYLRQNAEGVLMDLVFKTSKPGCRDGLIDRVLAHENMRIGVHVPRIVKTGHLGAAPCNPNT